MEDKLYHYKMVSNRVVDGDTVVAYTISLGFGLELRNTKTNPLIIRFAGIDAYEKKKSKRADKKYKKLGIKVDKYWELGEKATDFVKEIMDAFFVDIVIKTSLTKKNRGSFGRILGVIFYKKKGKWINLNNELVRKGLAYKTK